MKIQENVKYENNKVICTCYGQDKEFNTKEEAINFFTEAFYGCDPESSEASRYIDVLAKLMYPELCEEVVC